MNAGERTYAAAAALYDVAFSWDVTREVAWLCDRLGSGVRRIIEPGCGSGRMFPAFAQHGIEVAGVDSSETMVVRARARMAALGLPLPHVLAADMRRFDLGAVFDGAVCPINTFGYLLDEDAADEHFVTMARHLRPGARYLLQVDLLDTSVSVDYARDDCQDWTAEQGGVRVRCIWSALAFDAWTGLQTEQARFEVLSGPDAGRVFEDEHVVRKWSWADWQQLLDRSPFELAAVYDGDAESGYPVLPFDEGVEDGHLTWHELIYTGR